MPGWSTRSLPGSRPHEPEDEVPKKVFYGDGTAIEADTLADLRRACAAETVRFQWLAG
jgi:hypothetical protein